MLSPSCCNMNADLLYECPDLIDTIVFNSSNIWKSNSNGDLVTDGVVFAFTQGLYLPVSIAGTQLSPTTYNTLPQTEYSCPHFEDTAYSSDCLLYNFTSADFSSLLARQLLGASYFNFIDEVLPSWLTLTTRAQSLTESSAFTFEHYSTFIVPGENFNRIESCQDLDLIQNTIYSVISLKTMIVAEVVQNLYHYTPNEKETVCVAVDMCSGEDPPVYITLPPSSEEFMKSISQIQMLVNDGWEMTFEESMLSRGNIRINDTEIPSGYWNGVNFVDSISLLPQFDIRLKITALRKFMDSDVFWTILNVTGYVYYQPQTLPNEAEGMINGSIYLSLNMSFNGVPGKMILTAESNPALFSIMKDSNNIMMKLDYSTGDNDQFFSKIFHCMDRACPLDVFIQLTQRRNISFISIQSSEIALLIGSYTFPRKVLKHTISIDSRSSDDPLLSKAPLQISSNLSAGSQLVLNSFVSLKQPAVGLAISVVYQKNGSFTSKLAKVSFSMLNTVITTPVEISSNSGLKFSTFNADVFSMYKVQ
ncbi:PREDICTED: uncharacterized protein LOC109591721, partial [Amphimedon queenslandica]|uniref:Tectonic domain-containing protein n=1 Tax=Amphimedon queenslandica TaxID=400682 RepID=A0A1X7SS88_AMPQE